ncbi:hypothetical protein HJG53_11155 [Sphingomonas sp. ID1715]|uniref:hypothetical protein n=1 Tax=Sphingomonas sp. ID1715 TaxID=1656898 RepID=UPI001488D82D|nr:hypothetical protein [Sphingomonas sp. ID1715]NNM77464.1 hypothetical protein [Sphingomonas sp. ID1715]
MAKKQKSKKPQDNSTLIAGIAAGGIGLLLGLFVLGKRGRDNTLGAIDRALGLPSNAAGDGGSTAADLSLDQPHHGPGDRAPTDFRPDMSAGVDPRKRDAFAPATLPNPNSAEPAM